jgi:hypothetical protein
MPNTPTLMGVALCETTSSGQTHALSARQPSGAVASAPDLQF